MERVILEIIWLGLYWYLVEQTAAVKKGKTKRIITLLLAAAFLGTAFGYEMLQSGTLFPEVLAWSGITILFLLFVLFFDEEPFIFQWWRVALPGAVILLLLLTGADIYAANGILLWMMFLLLAGKRGYLSWQNGIIMGMIYGVLSIFLLLFEDGIWNMPDTMPQLSTEILSQGCIGLILFLEYLLLFLTEGTLFTYKKGFENQTERFWQDMLSHQYEEIKNIYMNMRGWRHDYHNHLQVMKAQLALENYGDLENYLDELEHDLDGVDTYVKSGNLMVDAILNSKLTLAEEREIKLHCKAKLPENMQVADVDLCVILGNLLENAIEACEQIEKEKRFLRIYMAVNKSQLYISIQNAAKEELDFNECNYITNKRGSHGFGMCRVKAMVDKYGGYLNLANEPGIFAAEVTMPLDIT